ncbi:hypothetical protein NE237_019058 [Protea cynaroides]|uniref:RFTS domain-containing protein n=1 Tax=Protea cynaroides TaxID=273540 RepID=A0A9Q0KB60_9MAGN|nr:hypothetical protein NE237_019058 [Protea cynaroides]
MVSDKAIGNDPKGKKRNVFEKPYLLRSEIPKRATAKHSKEPVCYFNELLALRKTFSLHDTRRPYKRRITDFIIHDVARNQQPIEVDMLISGTVLLWKGSSEEKKVKGLFWRIKNWEILGFEEGSPRICVSTNFAHYYCVEPANNYKKFYDHFSWKIRFCIQVFQKQLSKTYGGNPDLCLNELLARVVYSLRGSKCFLSGMSVISLGEFIYNQLIRLDEPSKEDTKFFNLPVLVTLRDYSMKLWGYVSLNPPSGESLKFLKMKDRVAKLDESISDSSVDEEDVDARLARWFQKVDFWGLKKEQHSSATVSYGKVHEDEIANEYPLPAYYSHGREMDEFILFGINANLSGYDNLPRVKLHNWSIYNCESRLISLELLPMKSHSNIINGKIFASGSLTFDDGSTSIANNVDGIPIYLSPIKEWMIKVEPSMIIILIRTDWACYRLEKPSEQYAPYETVLKTARLAISIFTLLKAQSRESLLSFCDVIKKVSEFEKDHPAYISTDPAVVERYVVVHGRIILQHLAENPDDMIREFAFVTDLLIKRRESQHKKLEVEEEVK